MTVLHHYGSLPSFASTCKATPPIMAALEVKPASPSKPTAIPAKLDVRPAKTASPRAPHDLPQHALPVVPKSPVRPDDPALSLSLSWRDPEEGRDPAPVPWAVDSHHRTIKQLPRGCKITKMVGEGAANAVFEFTLPDGRYFKHQKTRLLLRVAKQFEEDDRPRFDYLEQYRHYRMRIKPILGSYVLHQELVVLRSSGIIDTINEHLRSINGTRTPKFKDSYVEASELGFLVEDMRPDDPSQSLLVEFKPKWLSQSPSAPKNAIRCRQCAKELHSYVTEPGLKRPVPTQAKPCPLTLGRDNATRAGTDSSRRLVPHLDKLGDHLSSTLDVLRDEEAFECLRRAQENNDMVGPLGADKCDSKFALAMTLRDCTCFALVSTQASKSRASRRPLKVRFGDFDMKIPEFRLDYWRRVEEELIEGGFYTAGWLYCDKTFYTPPTNCVLESLNQVRVERTEVMHLQNPAADKEDVPPLPRNGTTKMSRTPVVRGVETDVSTLGRCLEAYKKEKPALRRARHKQEAESWFSSCRQF